MGNPLLSYLLLDITLQSSNNAVWYLTVSTRLGRSLLICPTKVYTYWPVTLYNYETNVSDKLSSLLLKFGR